MKYIEHALRYTWQSIFKMYNEEAKKYGGTLAHAQALRSEEHTSELQSQD